MKIGHKKTLLALGLALACSTGLAADATGDAGTAQEQYINMLLQEGHSPLSIILNAVAQGYTLADTVYYLSRAQPGSALDFAALAARMLPALPDWACSSSPLVATDGQNTPEDMEEFLDGNILRLFSETGWEDGDGHLDVAIDAAVLERLMREQGEDEEAILRLSPTREWRVGDFLPFTLEEMMAQFGFPARETVDPATWAGWEEALQKLLEKPVHLSILGDSEDPAWMDERELLAVANTNGGEPWPVAFFYHEPGRQPAGNEACEDEVQAAALAGMGSSTEGSGMTPLPSVIVPQGVGPVSPN